LNHLIRHGTESYLTDGHAIDLDHPEPNARVHEDIVTALRKTVADFVTADDVKPEIDLPLSRLNAAVACLADAELRIGTLTQENQELKARFARLEGESGDGKQRWLRRGG
jgi:hypothetical protein